MKHRIAILFMAVASLCQAAEPHWTDTRYPDYVRKVTDFGERPDWSHDGKRILFVERSFGDVYEFDRSVSNHL